MALTNDLDVIKRTVNPVVKFALKRAVKACSVRHSEYVRSTEPFLDVTFRQHVLAPFRRIFPRRQYRMKFEATKRSNGSSYRRPSADRRRARRPVSRAIAGWFIDCCITADFMASNMTVSTNSCGGASTHP